MAHSFVQSRVQWLLLGLAFVFSLSESSIADTDTGPKFIWPVSCTIEQDCWVVNYVDDNPLKTDPKDFNCGGRTYKVHDGTDIAIKDRAAIANNTSVLAAADGTVERTRDSIEDGHGTKADLKNAEEARNGCGNAVIIDHGNGWETLYCHMKRGSIIVTAGQRVHAGDKIGSVGESGMAEFPHLHFGVIHNKQIFDPFTGQPPTAGCGLTNVTSLWSTPVPYETLIPYATGFTNQLPNNDKLVDDTSSPHQLNSNEPILAFWLLIYGVETGDHIDLKIIDPNGNIYVQKSDVQDKKKARIMKYIGLRTQNHPLHSGTYIGKATLSRTLAGGQILTHSPENTILIVK